MCFTRLLFTGGYKLLSIFYENAAFPEPGTFNLRLVGGVLVKSKLVFIGCNQVLVRIIPEF